jgi:polar amino acid transport system permease protein
VAFDWGIIEAAGPDLLRGALVTLRITLGAFAAALCIGLPLGVARQRSALARRLSDPYVEIFRGTPLLIQLFFIYYGLPSVGLVLPADVAAYVGLGLNGGAYLCEIVRGSLAGVAHGQEEAALATGLTTRQTLCYVLLPQALRTALPPVVNAYASMLKESSLVSVLAITELTRVGQLVYTRTFRPFEIYLAVGALYFLLTWMATALARRLEARLGATSCRA